MLQHEAIFKKLLGEENIPKEADETTLLRLAVAKSAEFSCDPGQFGWNCDRCDRTSRFEFITYSAKAVGDKLLLLSTSHIECQSCGDKGTDTETLLEITAA